MSCESTKFTQQSESNITVKQIFFISNAGVALGILHHKGSQELARDISLHTHKSYKCIRFPGEGCHDNEFLEFIYIVQACVVKVERGSSMVEVKSKSSSWCSLVDLLSRACAVE